MFTLKWDLNQFYSSLDDKNIDKDIALVLKEGKRLHDKYISSDFFNYAEIATNFLLHALTFYIIYKGCKSFRRHRASQSSHLEVVP